MNPVLKAIESLYEEHGTQVFRTAGFFSWHASISEEADHFMITFSRSRYPHAASSFWRVGYSKKDGVLTLVYEKSWNDSAESKVYGSIRAMGIYNWATDRLQNTIRPKPKNWFGRMLRYVFG